VKLPEDLPFYPGSWLIGFALLAYGWVEWGPWPAVGAFFAFMIVQAVVVEVWAALRPPSNPNP
jgi:predicted small integral membrane protein